jgi:hypothetical protein
MSVVGNDNQVYANELNYKMQPYLYPQYQNSRILPLSGGQTVTMTVGSGNQEKKRQATTAMDRICNERADKDVITPSEILCLYIYDTFNSC